MKGYQENKLLVLDFYRELESASRDELESVLQFYCTKDYFWRGMHPFYEQTGPRAVNQTFWQPLYRSFTSMQRRQDVFMAGRNDIDNGDTEWVCSMGHLMGLFDKDWLGIPATGKVTFLPYVEFHRIEGGKISETASFCDIIRVMQQAGVNPLPEQTGAAIINPSPRTHDGLHFDPQNPDEGLKTLNLINKMVSELQSASLHSTREELMETWHKNMTWFGPAGIGATYTVDRYEEQHQGPFSEGLDAIEPIGHLCRIAEGCYGGFFGWANLSMKPSGGFMGLPASDKRAEMRVVDIYRREGDRLAENWIFIDILHFLSMQGLDVLTRMKNINRR